MKLLNLRLLPLYSGKSIRIIDSLGLTWNPHAYYSPIHLKCVRKYRVIAPHRPTANAFRYEYESSELLEKLKSLKNYAVISTVDNNVNIEAILKNFQATNIQSNEDVRAMVTSIILAAKFDENVENIIEKAFGADAVARFLALCDTWLDQMTADDAVSTLVAFDLLKIPLHHPVNRKLTTHVTNMLRGNFDKSKTQNVLLIEIFASCRFACVSAEIVVKFGHLFA